MRKNILVGLLCLFVIGLVWLPCTAKPSRIQKAVETQVAAPNTLPWGFVFRLSADPKKYGLLDKAMFFDCSGVLPASGVAPFRTVCATATKEKTKEMFFYVSAPYKPDVECGSNVSLTKKEASGVEICLLPRKVDLEGVNSFDMVWDAYFKKVENDQQYTLKLRIRRFAIEMEDVESLAKDFDSQLGDLKSAVDNQ